MDGYQLLANAIVKKAADDYRQALKDLKRHPDYSAAQSMKSNCERFFKSGWFGVLTSIDGLWLMDTLKKEVQGYDSEGIS